MKRFYFIQSCLALLMLGVASCTQDENPGLEALESGISPQNYQVLYTDAQLKNWAETGSPYLENELDNSSNCLIAPELRSQDGLFKLPAVTPQTRAFGVNPQQNRYWSMIRLKITLTDERIKRSVTEAIDKIEDETNIRFYNAINDDEYDPIYHIKLPHVTIRMALSGEPMGSSYVGRLGGEQFIYIPADAKNWTSEKRIAFVMRALCNVAGMYNEQQRNDRDNYVIINTNAVSSVNRYHFNKITTNFYSRGNFDQYSITLASTNEFGTNSIRLKNNTEIQPNLSLSTLDRMFLNYFYLPYVARSDTYQELDNIVYDGNNRQLTESERLELQAYLNNGNPTPPTGGHIEKVPW